MKEGRLDQGVADIYQTCEWRSRWSVILTTTCLGLVMGQRALLQCFIVLFYFTRNNFPRVVKPQSRKWLIHGKVQPMKSGLQIPKILEFWQYHFWKFITKFTQVINSYKAIKN